MFPFFSQIPSVTNSFIFIKVNILSFWLESSWWGLLASRSCLFKETGLAHYSDLKVGTERLICFQVALTQQAHCFIYSFDQDCMFIQVGLEGRGFQLPSFFGTFLLLYHLIYLPCGLGSYISHWIPTVSSPCLKSFGIPFPLLQMPSSCYSWPKSSSKLSPLYPDGCIPWTSQVLSFNAQLSISFSKSLHCEFLPLWSAYTLNTHLSHSIMTLYW